MYTRPLLYNRRYTRSLLPPLSSGRLYRLPALQYPLRSPPALARPPSQHVQGIGPGRGRNHEPGAHARLGARGGALNCAHPPAQRKQGWGCTPMLVRHRERKRNRPGQYTICAIELRNTHIRPCHCAYCTICAENTQSCIF